MDELETGRLGTGEAAYRVGGQVYALLSYGKKSRAFGTYKTDTRPFAEIKASDLKNQYQFFANETEFYADAVVVARSLVQLDAFQRVSTSVSTQTPRGKADWGVRYTHGMNFYTTPGHGYMKLASRLNAKMPDILRNKDGWYEQDCEIAKVQFAMPHFFTDKERESGIEGMKNFFPEAFEAITGEVIPDGQSIKKDGERFARENAENWVCISALGADDGMVDVIATKGGQRQTFGGPEIEERMFRVPNAEYDPPFVIDLSRHEETILEPGQKAGFYR